MQPIPDSLIASRSVSKTKSFSFPQQHKFCLPLIYLVVTACLCYSFLFALVISSQKTQPSGGVRERGSILQQISSGISEKLVQQSNKTSENSREQLSLSSTPSALTLSTSRTSDPLQRKTLFSLRRKVSKRTNNKHGSWRSYPSKIRTRHQDVGCPTSPNNIPSEIGKVDGGKSSVQTKIYRYPWKDDGECKKFNISFAKQSTFKPRALASFPGSGNSWIRYLIENASGYFTGSVYGDKVLFEQGLLGEKRNISDGTTIVQKTHHLIYNEKQHSKAILSKTVFNYRGILIIRNPFDALVSFRHWVKSKCADKHQGYVGEDEFRGPDWTDFVLKNIMIWSNLITTWIDNSSDYLIVLYEDLLENPRKQLTHILEYLKQPIDTERLDCLMKVKNLEGPFHRAHPTRNTSKSPLTLGSIPSSTKQGRAIHTEQPLQKVNSSTRFQTNSKEPHQKHHRKSQSTPQLSSSLSSTPVGERKNEEQKEDKFSPSKLSSLNSFHQQQNQYAGEMTSSIGASGSPIGNTTSSVTTLQDRSTDHNNNGLNKASILRLDLIIQDNIDKINRFFKQKSIPVHLHYSPRPTTIRYFLQPV